MTNLLKKTFEASAVDGAPTKITLIDKKIVFHGKKQITLLVKERHSWNGELGQRGARGDMFVYELNGATHTCENGGITDIMDHIYHNNLTTSITTYIHAVPMTATLKEISVHAKATSLATQVVEDDDDDEPYSIRYLLPHFAFGELMRMFM
jgi:hypothetical protein